MIFANWRGFILGWVLIVAGTLLAHLVQTAGDIRVQEVRFPGAEGKTLAALLYVPPTATAETPAPGVLAVHGYINSREVQAPFAIELARRGYVVLALDQPGHGYSEAPTFAGGFGGPAALTYLRALPFVDANNIGLEGHSMGGWAVLAAAAAMPDAYQAVVLQGSSTGSGFARPGTPTWPRNLALVFGRYDEFAPLMWEVAKGRDVSESGKLQALFGTDDAVVANQVYGSIAEGNARILHVPAITHPGNHISREAVAHTIAWFAQTLEGGHGAAVTNQIWWLKELGTLLALLGFVVLLLGSFHLLLSLPYLQPLAQAPLATAVSQRHPRWWFTLGLSAGLPVLTFYPFMHWGAGWVPASAWLPQHISNQILVWALLNGLIFTVLDVISRRKSMPVHYQWLRSLLAAFGSIAMVYVAVAAAQLLFHLDFRFWFVGVKLLSWAQLQIMLVYVLPLTLFFLMVLRTLHGSLSVTGDSVLAHYASNIAALMGGFLLFLLLQYGSLVTRGQLLTPGQPLNTIIMLQVVPMMLLVALVATYTWRRTGSYLPGAFISGVFVSWYLAAGQATQFG